MEPDTQVGGTVLGRFRIERVLGRGGMATVFAAFDEKRGASVALKLLKKELTRDPMVVRRFEREAKAASHLRHPNVIEILEWGVEGEDAFISMEMASGIDLLRALSQERPMRQARAVLILAQVCSALTAAHAKGIVHRDLKPENILLVQEPEELGKERAKVLDFGIAKILDIGKGVAGAEDPPSYVTKTALTRVGTIVGTPAYMSPEQCRGGDIDGRSDIYACGVLLYQLVTGELPFSGETPLHTAMRHIHAQPRNPAELRRGLSPAIERAILKALAKWPGERQQTADQLREELYAAFPSLPDRGDVVLPVAQKGGQKSVPPPNARAESARPPGEVGRTQAITTGGLGSTPLRGVRLNRAAEPLPTEPNQQQTERDSPRSKDARAEEEDDEPRTFLIPADSITDAVGRHSTAPQTQMPATQIPDTQMPSTDKIAPAPSKPSAPGAKSAQNAERGPPMRSEPAPRPPMAPGVKSTARGLVGKPPDPERRVAPTALSTTPRTKANTAPQLPQRPSPSARPPSASSVPTTNTETGLTPTALTNLPKSALPSAAADNAKTERGSAAMETDRFPGIGGPEVDEDEPATFVRDPGPGPGSTPHVKTLVMDEPSSTLGGGVGLQLRQAPAVTRDPPVSYAGGAAAQNPVNTVAQPPNLSMAQVQPQTSHVQQPQAAQQQPVQQQAAQQQAAQQQAAQQQAAQQQAAQQQAAQQQAAQQQPVAQPMPQANQRGSIAPGQGWEAPRSTGYSMNGSAASNQGPTQNQSAANYLPTYPGMSNTARLADEGSEPQVKATVRMNPQETVAKANVAAAMRGDRSLAPIGTGWNESTIARRRGPQKSGLIGQIDALSGSTGMLIGIGLGLALAAVGLLLAVALLN